MLASPASKSAGGPHIVDAELAAVTSTWPPTTTGARSESLGATTYWMQLLRTANEGERLFRKKLALDLKFERAMAMTKPRTRLPLRPPLLESEMQEQRLKIQERKLAEKCNQALRSTNWLRSGASRSQRAKYGQAAKEARKAEEVSLRKEGQRYACDWKQPRTAWNWPSRKRRKPVRPLHSGELC